MYQQHNTCLALLVLPLSQGHATAALLVSSERYVVIIRSAIDYTFPSVCLQHACTVHKQMSFYRICLWKLVGHGSGSVAKNSAETFAAGFPTWWFVVYNGDKNCDFRPMSRFISDTIQDRTIVTRLIGTHTHIGVNWNDFETATFQPQGASRGLSATAELLVKFSTVTSLRFPVPWIVVRKLWTVA